MQYYMHYMPNNMHNMQNDNMQNNMQFNMQNMLAICRFGADCLVLTVICIICQIICSICPICYDDFQYAQYTLPTLLMMGYNVTRSNFKTAQVQLISSTYWYILVYTGTYRYILPQHSKLHLIKLHPPSCTYQAQQNAWLGPFSQFSSESS